MPCRTRHPYLLAGVMLCAAGCSGSDSVAGSQPPFALPEADPPPIAFAWVGSYTGAIRGEDRGVAFDNLPVTFTISPSREAECPGTTPDAVTAHLRITGGPDVFRVCDPPITSSIEALFEYTEANRRHVVSLGRFSGGGGTANVILGDVTIQEPDANGVFATVYHGVFTVVRAGAATSPAPSP